MAVTNFSPLLGLALPTTGDLSGTWGTVVNDAITGLLDSAVAGTTTLSADTDVTLSTTNGAANQARNAVILWTATGTVTRNITAPAQSKAYVVINATGGTQSIVIRGSGPTTGVTIPAGARALVAWNGTDFVKIVSNPVALTTDISGVLPAANGGTGLSSPGALGNVLTSDGTTWQSAIPAAGVSLSADNTWTGTQTFSGTSSKIAVVLSDAAEVTTVSATAATGTINYDVTTQSVLFYTTNASGNWTLNVRASSGTSLDTIMTTGQSVTIAFLVTQGATAYYQSAFQVDGAAVTPQWQGGAAPTAGNASGVDIYVMTIIKTASATFSVFASQTRFA